VTSVPDSANELLRVSGLHAFYGESHVIHGIDFHVAAGAVVTLLGRNGSGRSTTLKSIPGLVPRRIASVRMNGRATIGQLGNLDHENEVIGKAGRQRHLGKRPSVRGIAMNPVDHPPGGGEGRQGLVLRRAKSAGGKPTGKSQKTRTPKKYSNYLMVSRRKVGKRSK